MTSLIAGPASVAAAVKIQKKMVYIIIFFM